MRWIVATMVLITALIVVLAVMLGSAVSGSGGGHHQKRIPRLRQGQPDATSLVMSVRVPT